MEKYLVTCWSKKGAPLHTLVKANSVLEAITVVKDVASMKAKQYEWMAEKLADLFEP